MNTTNNNTNSTADYNDMQCICTCFVDLQKSIQCLINYTIDFLACIVYILID